MKNIIPEEIKLKFTQYLLFKGDIEYNAIKLAYDDVKRTFRYQGQDASGAKKEIINFLKQFIKETSLNTFQEDHKIACETIINIYHKYGFTCFYGQAQKWINMTFKYLITASDKYSFLLPELHIPIDNVVYKLAAEKLTIKKPKKAWSKLNCEEYLEYQSTLRNKLSGKFFPLVWEFNEWLNHQTSFF